jgi:peptide/nickel transport system permease protein
VAKYILRRLLVLVPTWFAIGLLAFFLIRLAPGDPAAIILGTEGLAGIEQVHQRLGLDRPLLVQLGSWMAGAARGDLGDSFFLGRSVAEAIFERIPVTLSLAFLSIGFAVFIGVPLGIVAALRPNSARDTSIMGLSLLGLSLPEFFTGLILIYVFSVALGWMPAGGYEPLSAGLLAWARHLLMPGFALGFLQSALIARMTRSSMLEVLGSDYVRTARAKGLWETRVIWKHALRNAILPVITVVGMVFALLLSGAFITEVLFRLPGAGNLIISAVKRRDYPIVQGGLLVFSTAVLVINMVVDLLYVYIDPRIKYQ